MSRKNIQEYLLGKQIRVEYSRNLSQSNVVFRRICKEDKELFFDLESEISDQIQMIKENDISSLLQFSIHLVDEEEVAKYQIGQMSSLCEMFQTTPGKYAEITSLFQGLIKLLYDIESHLLDIRHVLFDFEYIYWDNCSKEFKFLFYPYFSENPQEGIRNMANILLKAIDYSDKRVVQFVYEFHRYTQIENFCISETFFHFYKRQDNVIFSFQKPQIETLESQMGVKSVVRNRAAREKSTSLLEELERSEEKQGRKRCSPKKEDFLLNLLKGLKSLTGIK